MRERLSDGNRLHPRDAAREGHVEACLGGDVPIVMVSDYVRAWPQLVAGYLQAPLVVLGTDGFGRSDTRASLRSFFEVDRFQIVLAALTQMREGGEAGSEVCADAIARYGIESERAAPWNC